MSNRPPQDTDPQDDTAPAVAETVDDTATDPHAPDFSRLRLARASLDNAFPKTRAQ